MLCGSVIFVNENISEIFSPFEEQGLIGPCAKFQFSQSCLSCFSSISITFLTNI